jgi:hypothetical protein
MLFQLLPQDVGVEPEIEHKQHLVYQRHPFARNVVKFQHFLSKLPLLEVCCPWAGNVPGTPAIRMKM